MYVDNVFDSFVDYLRENEDGIDQVNDLNTACRVLDELAKDGMSAAALVRRCAHWSLAEDLVTHVTKMFWNGQKGRRRRELLDALAMMTSEWWDETGLEPHWFLTQINGWEMLDHFLAYHKAIILDPQGRLYIAAGRFRGLALVEDFWTYKVRYYIVRKDFRRAWEELNKAYKGFLNHGIVKENYKNRRDFIEACADRYNRGWKATYETIGRLAMELYHSMSNAEKLEGSLDDFRTCTSWHDISYYKLKGVSKPMVCIMKRSPRPSFELAKHFIDPKKKVSARPLDYWYEFEYRFMDSGAAILMIAEHFASMKREKRRRKYETKLAAYEAMHK